VKVRKGTQFFHKLKMSSRISRDGGKVTFHWISETSWNTLPDSLHGWL